MQKVREPIKQISEYVIRILGQNPSAYSLDGTNTYLIGKTNKRILLDSGQNIPEYKDLLLSVLKDTNSVIDQVLLTHGHLDHSHGIKQILEICKSVKISKFEYLDSDKELEKEYGFKYNILKENEIVQGDGFNLKVIETKGHNPDHCCYFMEPENILFTGDFILSGSSTVIRDLDTQFKNFQTALNLNADRLFAGHGPEIIGKQLVKKEIETNLNHRLQREEQLKYALKSENSSPKNLEQLFQIIYPNITDSKLIMGAKNNILVNITRLVKINLVKASQEDIYTENCTFQIINDNNI